MSESSATKKYWTRFERAALPAALTVSRPQNVAFVAKALVFIFITFGISALLAPWTQNIQGRGRVIAYSPEQRQQTIEATVTGTIAEWFVEEGSHVNKGDPIVRLADNDAMILDRLDAQRSAVQVRRMAQEQKVLSLADRVESLKRSQSAEISAAEAQVAISQQDLAAVQQEVSAAQAELDTNELNYRRQSSLRADGLASQREYELAELAARQSRAALASANAKFKAAKNRLSQSRAALRRVTASANAEIEAASANLRSAETEVASANEGLARLEVDIARQQAQTILAPVDGTILRVIGRLGGAQVSQGQVLAILVPSTEDRAVELYVDGNNASLIEKGRAVRLQFEGWPAVQFSGWPSVAVGTFGGVVAFVDAADDGRGNFRVVVVPDGDPEEPWPAASYLRQGVLAKGWVLLNQVRLGFEIWRQFNGFPPTTDPPPLANGGAQGDPK
ncbi:MAG: HlyD family efflux transporter periplasmic adaptor subunit [Myxococcota bacterium]